MEVAHIAEQHGGVADEHEGQAGLEGPEARSSRKARGHAELIAGHEIGIGARVALGSQVGDDDRPLRAGGVQLIAQSGLDVADVGGVEIRGGRDRLVALLEGSDHVAAVDIRNPDLELGAIGQADASSHRRYAGVALGLVGLDHPDLDTGDDFDAVEHEPIGRGQRIGDRRLEAEMARWGQHPGRVMRQGRVEVLGRLDRRLLPGRGAVISPSASMPLMERGRRRPDMSLPSDDRPQRFIGASGDPPNTLTPLPTTCAQLQSRANRQN